MLVAGWSLTKICNLNCIHCYNPQTKTKELQKENIFDLISEIKKLGALKIRITGGEPFIKNDLFDILKEKNKPDKPINNLALTKTFALFRDYCVENKDNIQVLLGGGLTISPDDVENITFTDQTGGFYLNTADKTTAQLQDIASHPFLQRLKSRFIM